MTRSTSCRSPIRKNSRTILRLFLFWLSGRAGARSHLHRPGPERKSLRFRPAAVRFLIVDVFPGTRPRTLRCKFHAYRRSPEALAPEINQHRTSASEIYSPSLGKGVSWSSSLVWGEGRNRGERATHSFLVETNFQHDRDTIYARWERVEKSEEELVSMKSIATGFFRSRLTRSVMCAI